MPNFYRSGPFPVYRRTFIPVSRTLEPAPAPKLAEPLKKALTSYISATGVVGECGELIEVRLEREEGNDLSVHLTSCRLTSSPSSPAPPLLMPPRALPTCT